MAAPFEKNVVSHMNVLIFLIFSSLSWQKKKKMLKHSQKEQVFRESSIQAKTKFPGENQF